MNINGQNKRDWLTMNIQLINCFMLLYNLTKLSIAKSVFYSGNIWYAMAIFKTIDMFFSEIYLAFSLVDKQYLEPNNIIQNITIFLITLGAADFLEFLGAFFIVTLISMNFRLYVVPTFKTVLEHSVEYIEKVKKFLKHKKRKQ